jgi:hypothetical protein
MVMKTSEMNDALDAIDAGRRIKVIRGAVEAAMRGMRVDPESALDVCVEDSGDSADSGAEVWRVYAPTEELSGLVGKGGVVVGSKVAVVGSKALELERALRAKDLVRIDFVVVTDGDRDAEGDEDPEAHVVVWVKERSRLWWVLVELIAGVLKQKKTQETEGPMAPMDTEVPKEAMKTEREETEVPMAPKETEGPTAAMVPKTQETKVETKAETAARLRDEARLAAEAAREAAEAADAAEAAAEQEEADAAEAAEALDEAEREKIVRRLWELNDEAKTLTDALDALDARKEERKKKRKRSRRIEEAGEAGVPEQHKNEEEQHQKEGTKTKRRRMFACDARDYVDSGFYGQGYCGGMGGIPVVDAAALCKWEKKLPRGEMMMVERPVCDGPREPRLTAVSEDVYGGTELAAELDAKYGGRVVKGGYEAEGLDGLLGRHGLEYRVFAVERHPSVECGCEPETWLETERVWLQRGSEALRVLDELIARERRPASPTTRPATLDRTTELTPWEPHPVWEPRSPRSPAYRPVRPVSPESPRSPVYRPVRPERPESTTYYAYAPSPVDDDHDDERNFVD